MLVITAVVVILDSALHRPVCFAVLLCVVRMSPRIAAAGIDRVRTMEIIRLWNIYVSGHQHQKIIEEKNNETENGEHTTRVSD